jgi:DNA-binding Lrp family transcriptional regulator
MRSEEQVAQPLEIDGLDRQILRLLRDDGRRANAEIARAVGASEPTVRKRLERLRENGVLRIIGLLDPVATGFPVDVFFAVKIRHGFAPELGRRLAAMNCVAFVGHTTGRFDMLVEAFFSDTNSLLDFYTAALSPEQGVMWTETYHILGVDKFNYMWDLPGTEPVASDPAGARSDGVSRASKRRGKGTVEIDSLDSQILRLLQDDGRRPNAEIARAVGVSEPTVRKRIERLRQNGVMRIIGLLDPAATGFPVYAMILIQVEGHLVREIGARLAAMGRVANVSYITGKAQIWCEAMLPGNQALYEFLSADLAAIEGIVTTEACQVLAIDKFNYMWDLPEGDHRERASLPKRRRTAVKRSGEVP